MYRNKVRLYDGDMLASFTLLFLPILLFGAWRLIVYQIRANKKHKENNRNKNLSKTMSSVSFWSLLAGLVLLGIFSGNWVHTGRVDLPLLIPGGILYLFSYSAILFQDY